MPPTNRAAVARLVSDALSHQGRGTAAKLALACGVSPSTVTKWRTGDTVPSPEVWPKIEQTLKLGRGAIKRAAEEPIDPADTPASPEEVAHLRQEVARLSAVTDALIAAKSLEDMILADPLLSEDSRKRLHGIYLVLSGQADV